MGFQWAAIPLQAGELELTPLHSPENRKCILCFMLCSIGFFPPSLCRQLQFAVHRAVSGKRGGCPVPLGKAFSTAALAVPPVPELCIIYLYTGENMPSFPTVHSFCLPLSKEVPCVQGLCRVTFTSLWDFWGDGGEELPCSLGFTGVGPASLE